MKDKKKYIFERHFIELEKADIVCVELGIPRKQFTELCKEIDLERKAEITELGRIRQLYNNKVKLKGFDFKGFKSFYYWYQTQYKKQEGCCYYCETDEKLIAAFIESRKNFIKRPNRGKHLEVERKDAKSNKYNEKNCVLACYFCNNDKSDIFNEKEYFEYLKDRKTFFKNQAAQ